MRSNSSLDLSGPSLLVATRTQFEEAHRKARRPATMTSLPPPHILCSVAAAFGVSLALFAWLRSDSEAPPAHPPSSASLATSDQADASSSKGATKQQTLATASQPTVSEANGGEATRAQSTTPAAMPSDATSAAADECAVTHSADGIEVPARAATSSPAAPVPSLSPRRHNGRAMHSAEAASDQGAAAAAAATTAAATTAASSSPIAAATVARIASPSVECGLPSCFDPLLFLYERRGLPFPRIRVLSDPAVELPTPYLQLLHHRDNMTPTLSRFWCDQHVSLRVIEKVEQREPTVMSPHGVLQRWIALQVDQPTHVTIKQMSQLDSSTSLQSAPPSTPAAAVRPAAGAPQSTPQTNGNGNGNGHTHHSRSSSTSSTSSTCSSSSTTASSSVSASAHKSSRRTHSAAKLPPKRGPKPGRLYYQESVQKIESAPSTPREAQRELGENALVIATPDAVTAPAAVAAPAAPAPSSSSPHLVEFGSIRVHLSALPESLRPAIWAGAKPFATLLLTATPQPIAQHIRPQAFFEIDWGADLEALTGVAATHTPLPSPPKVYGRCNHIYSDVDEKQLICEVVEIMPPMPQTDEE